MLQKGNKMRLVPLRPVKMITVSFLLEILLRL